MLEADNLGDRLEETSAHLNENFGMLFDDMLASRVDRLAAEPEDLETLVEAITLYHMVIEGMLALTGQHFILEYNEEQGTLPGFCEGFNNVARDEHRHVAFGARFLRDMAERDERYGEAIQRTLVECGPAADGVLQPPWAEETDELFGYSLEETRAFAMKALERRLKVIGLTPAGRLAERPRPPCRSRRGRRSASAPRPLPRAGSGRRRSASTKPASASRSISAPISRAERRACSSAHSPHAGADHLGVLEQEPVDLDLRDRNRR